MPELTDREKLEEIEEKIKTVSGGTETLLNKEIDWLIGQTSTYLDLKEGLKNNQLLADFYKDQMGDIIPRPEEFADWLLTHIQKEVK